MKIELNVNRYKLESYITGGGKIEALVNMEEFYAMLDRINPQILTNYIYMRLKAKSVNNL